MRREIEGLSAAYHQARQACQALDRDREPRAWAQADLDRSAAAGHLGNAVRDAARRLGLVRELSRTLAGTGYAVERLGFDAAGPQLTIDLDGGPETAAEQHNAADPILADRIRSVTEEFYSRTGVEILFPYDRLAS
ncbi:MAG TPA: hypothetical protein VKY74_27560 [Chloroflexia bacterium]|nr:hypothetical protein [Chloroflexia bacterium]